MTHRFRTLLLLALAVAVMVPVIQAAPATATVRVTTVRTVGHEVRAAELGPGISRTLRLANPARTVAVYWRSARGAQVGLSLSADGENFDPAVDAGPSVSPRRATTRPATVSPGRTPAGGTPAAWASPCSAL